MREGLKTLKRFLAVSEDKNSEVYINSQLIKYFSKEACLSKPQFMCINNIGKVEFDQYTNYSHTK